MPETRSASGRLFSCLAVLVALSAGCQGPWSSLNYTDRISDDHRLFSVDDPLPEEDVRGMDKTPEPAPESLFGPERSAARDGETAEGPDKPKFLPPDE